MSYTQLFGMSLGSSKAGLTLASQLVGTSGANYGSEITTGFAEIGSGNYQLIATIPDDFVGTLKTYQAGGTSTVLCIDAVNLPTDVSTLASDITAIKAKTDLINAGGFDVFVTSPIKSNGDIELVEGDDYIGDDAITLTFSSYTGSVLSAGTATLLVQSSEDYAEDTGVATFAVIGDVTVDGATVELEFEISGTATAMLTSTTPPEDENSYTYQAYVTLANGARRTLAIGKINTIREIDES